MAITKKTTANQLSDKAISNFGKCDYLFVNAGTIASGTIEDIILIKYVICQD